MAKIRIAHELVNELIAQELQEKLQLPNPVALVSCDPRQPYLILQTHIDGFAEDEFVEPTYHTDESGNITVTKVLHW